MANTVQCFKNAAIKFLEDEITSGENAKISIGNISISANQITNDSVSALINKGPRGAATSILNHVSDFASNTTSFLSDISTEVTTQMNAILSGSDLLGINSVEDLVNTTYQNVLITMVSNPALVFALSKNASSKASSDAQERVSTANDIINIINDIREARLQLSDPPLVKEPNEAAEDAVGELNYAKNLLTIVLSGFESTDPDVPTAGITRREVSYTNALVAMSKALDDLKIGEGAFKLSEYLKLRLDYKVLVEKFSGLNTDILTTVANVYNAESDYTQEKETRGVIEGKYVSEVYDRLKVLLEQMEAAIAKQNESLTLENFENWSKDLLSIYTLAHVAFDRDTDNYVDNDTSPDKIAYKSISNSLQTIEPQINADDLISKMTFLGELYFTILRNDRYTEQDVRSREDDIKSSLTTLAQYDQQIISLNSTYNPTIVDVLTVLALLTGRSGLDKLNEAISFGSVSGVYGFLTEQLGSSASGAAACLAGSISEIEDSEIREILLRTNARIQAIQRTKQIAGYRRENIKNQALSSINERVNRANQLKVELEGLNL